MATVLSFDKSDMRVGKNLPPRFRKNADEGIVGRVQDQRRHGDAVDDVGGGLAFVIIRCALKAAVVSRDLVVEITKAGHAPHAPGIEYSGKQTRFRS
jgi:hypothetical protein